MRKPPAHDLEFIGLRRDLHRQPELSFQEHRTSDLVASKLSAWGYRVERNLGGTGVVGELKRGKGKRRIGLRAEMDALSIHEVEGREWGSQTAGVMHACGHDGHTAMLLSAAKLLSTDKTFSGTVTLIFQPAEEVGGSSSGAVRMMADG